MPPRSLFCLSLPFNSAGHLLMAAYIPSLKHRGLDVNPAPYKTIASLPKNATLGGIVFICSTIVFKT